MRPKISMNVIMNRGPKLVKKRNKHGFDSLNAGERKIYLEYTSMMRNYK
jgi:hypothetical protein